MSSSLIEMDIAYQFVKIYILLAHNGFVTVLIKISTPLMAAIEIDGRAGEDFPHQIAERSFAGADQEVQVICHQRPGITATAGQSQTVGQALQKLITVGIVTEDILSI
jgi:transcriptional regulator